MRLLKDIECALRRLFYGAPPPPLPDPELPVEVEYAVTSVRQERRKLQEVARKIESAHDPFASLAQVLRPRQPPETRP
jgi:hypothetical protein